MATIGERSTRLRRAITAAVLVVLVALLGACGTASDRVGVRDSRSTTSDQVSVGSSRSRCTLASDLTRCQAVAVTFRAPLDLDGVRRTADQQDGAVLVLWRADPVCVEGPAGPSSLTTRLASQFAYWDADTIPARRAQGPPISDGGYTFALWRRWAQEWQAATEPGVLFSGAVFVVPDDTDQPTTPEIVERRAVAAYRTDDGAVLYLRDHDAALAGILPTVPLSC